MIEVPEELWKRIIKLLIDRQFVETGDGDDDNDYEVHDLLTDIENKYKL